MPETSDHQVCLQNIPSPPSVAIKLLELFDDPATDVDAIGEVIQVDPALTSKLVSYCNSPLFGGAQNIESVNRAIIVLGLKSVKMISLSFSLIETSSDRTDFDFSSFWRRSLALAVSSKALASLDESNPDKCFLVGLMQNIGELGLYQNAPDHPASVDVRTVGDIIDQEQQAFNTNRFAVGCDILEAWSFPAVIVSALKQIAENVDNNTDVARTETAAAMAAILTSDQPELEMIATFKDRFLETYGNDDQAFESLFETTLGEWKSYAKLLDFDYGEDVKTLREIEMAARLKITEASLAQTQDQLKMERENLILKSNAGKDALTGARNRQAYDEDAKSCYERCRRVRKPFTLLVVDIDHFKNCNDTYGHQVGDEALKLVADSIQNCLRNYDNLYRYGGEEFVVTLPECDREQGFLIAERLRKCVANKKLLIENQSISLTVSIGVVTSDVPHLSELAELFELGDQGLYRAKSDGRNRCVAVQDICEV